MTTSNRLARLTALLRSDPRNELLLAEVADAALAEGALGEADKYIQEGLRQQGATDSWRFRESRLRIAQRRLEEALTLLQQLRQELPDNSAVGHDLAYVHFLRGDAAECERLLAPWVETRQTVDHRIAALWLRALHHQDKLQEALRWVAKSNPATLYPLVAGVASLIALDAGDTDAAGEMSALALQSDPDQTEALVAAGCVALSAMDLGQARSLLQHATTVHPHQARAWSALGYTELIGMQAVRARAYFEKALQVAPEDVTALLGLGWACVILGDQPAAGRAFDAIVALDPEYSEAHAGLAVVAALSGAGDAATLGATRAQMLDPKSISARLARVLGAGDPNATQDLQRLLSELLDSAGIRHVGLRQTPND